MEFEFNEKAYQKISNAPIKEMNLKYAVDTKHVVNGVIWLIALPISLIIIELLGIMIFNTIWVDIPIVFLIGVIFYLKQIIEHARGKNYNKIIECCKAKCIDINDVENDFKYRTVNFGNVLCMIGDRYIILSNRIIPINDVLWLYFSDFKKTGIGKAKSQYTINILCKDGENVVYYCNPQIGAFLLNEIEKKHPRIILGYSLELEKLFVTDRNAFVDKAEEMRPDSCNLTLKTQKIKKAKNHGKYF